MAAGAASVLAAEADRGADLVATVRRLLAEAESLVTEARTDKDRANAIRAIQAGARAAETLGRLQGQIGDGVQINIAAAPALAELTTAVLLALVDMPEARARVAAALSQQRSVPMLEHTAIDVPFQAV